MSQDEKKPSEMPMSRDVLDRYDAALFDLDGVIYLGPDAVPGAVEGIAELRRRSVGVGFVTNNAARTPDTVVKHLRSLGIETASADVVTSAQAGAKMLANALPAGSKVLVIGTEALVHEVESVQMTVVGSADDNPDAVIQGYNPTLAWTDLDEASIAIQRGARWFATNTDSNRPTDRGIVPGAGTQIDAVRQATGIDPEGIAGKPYPPLLQETRARLGCQHPIFVGDRIDTDIMGANAVGMDSLFVFTGTHGARDLVLAPGNGRPTHIGWGLDALVKPAREIQWVSKEGSRGSDDRRLGKEDSHNSDIRQGGGSNGDLRADHVPGCNRSKTGGIGSEVLVQCRDQWAWLEEDAVQVRQIPSERDEQLDLLWAIAQLVWRCRDEAEQAGIGDDMAIDVAVIDQLDQLH